MGARAPFLHCYYWEAWDRGQYYCKCFQHFPGPHSWKAHLQKKRERKKGKWRVAEKGEIGGMMKLAVRVLWQGR